MDRPQIHYEVTARRRAGGSWALEHAGESRAYAIELADALLAERQALQVRVSKEAMHPLTGEFSSVVIVERGDPDVRSVKRAARGASRETSPCASPQDLYGLHARETIGRVLEAWLARERVTVFELIHRADLLERLEASGLELQGAMQRVAVAEAQGNGRSVHEIIRGHQALVERATARVAKDARAGAFPAIEADTVRAVLASAAGKGEADYRLGGSVAATLAPATTWAEKLDRLLDLTQRAMEAGDAGQSLLKVIETPLSEMLEGRAGLRDLLGVEGDLGDELGALTRLAAPAEVEATSRLDPRGADLPAPLSGAAARLSRFFEAGAFSSVRRAIGRRIVRELSGPRRLRPTDPWAEIAMLRALARTLTATGARLLEPDDIRRAFVERSRALLAAEFVGALLRDRGSALAECEALVWLADNVAGQANKRAAAKLMSAAATAHRLEMELLGPGDPPAARLSALARVQKGVAGAGLEPEDAAPIVSRLGALGAAVEARHALIAALVRVDAEPTHKLFLLAKLASGESAPLGPVTERARAEAFRLMRRPEARETLKASPELRERLSALLPAA